MEPEGWWEPEEKWLPGEKLEAGDELAFGRVMCAIFGSAVSMEDLRP